jgi:hypothetical protein
VRGRSLVQEGRSGEGEEDMTTKEGKNKACAREGLSDFQPKYRGVAASLYRR